ncbi:MAG: type II CAAX endopeptidase family protein [Candidatus Microsaccharimonas sp.]
MAIVLPLWVLASFVLVQVVLYLVTLGLHAVGVSFQSANENVLNAVFGAIVYVLTIAMVIGLPWLIKKYKTSREDIGLSRLPSWLDILLAPVGFIIYLIVSAIFILIASQLSFINLDQVQDTGFSQLGQGYEYLVAFMMLVVIAPVAEEVLFRGFLLGKLRKYVPIWAAILITSLLFAFVHGAVNIGIDVFALSIVLCLLRLVSGTIWPSILLHMLKNSIAFYLLFINPTLLTTLGG